MPPSGYPTSLQPRFLWTAGSGAPTADGFEGDFYLDADTGDIYRWTAGAWASTGNIKGATGAAGETGADGATGAAGADGADGAPGNRTFWLDAAPDEDTNGGDLVSGDIANVIGVASYDIYTWDGAAWTLRMTVAATFPGV